MFSDMLMLQVEMKRLRQVNKMNAYIIFKKRFDRVNVFIENAGSNKIGGITSLFAILHYSSAYGSSLSSPVSM